MNKNAVLLFLMLLCSAKSFFGQYKNNSHDKILFKKIASKVNPIDNDFPGGRGANELIVYTPAFGNKTKTNQYGIEAVVIDNKIQSVGGNNSVIPSNGFVISGHGTMLQWISKELFPGIEVRLHGREIFFTNSDSSKLFYANYLVKEVEEKFVHKGSSHKSISLKTLNQLKKQIKNIKNKLSDSSSQFSNDNTKNATTILDLALKLYYKSFPSLSNEIRATWYHLKEKSPQELEETIKNMVDIGFNMICPEVIYGGYAIYPGAPNSLEQNPAFRGWDPMRELERLCTKYKMKLIPWVWVFFIGQDNSPLIKLKPNWMAVSRQNEMPAKLEANHHFFCPSKIGVKKFWLDVYNHLITNYKFDGLQLDYIRYPVSLPYEDGFCYCDTCRSKFKAISGFDPLSINPNENPKIWNMWTEYRKEQVTSFVKDIAMLVHNQKPNMKLSADVFPLFEESLNYKFQDWGNWLYNGYLDEIFTMSYTPDVEQVKYESKFLVDQLPKGVNGYVGLGPFLGFRPEILVKEIFYAQEAGANGVCIFSYGSLNSDQIFALKNGPFREKAIID